MAAVLEPRSYRLQDNLVAKGERVFLTGTQALVRLLLSQRRRDRERGLTTAGFVSGYRGSPLGVVDLALWKARQQLDAHDIRFVPAINEDLAATMLIGTQQAGTHTQRQVEGVFGMWYGKGPGVDRSGDALHHGNAAGASRLGGVLLIVGDDHTAASSSIPHASDATLASWRIPVIHPASVEDYEYYGLWGWALSRFSGAWVAFKAITETVESGRSFVPPAVPRFDMPARALLQHRREYSAREFLTPAIELRMEQRLEAVRLFSRHHPLDRVLDPEPKATLGIVSVGKAALDTRDALDRLRMEHPGLPPLRHLQIGLVWPLDAQTIREFSRGLEHLLVIEEKGPVVEDQIKDLFFNEARRPTVNGKRDRHESALVPATGQLSASLASRAVLAWLEQCTNIKFPGRVVHAAPAPQDVLLRRPYFCSGCPHSTSTRVPEGSQALGGVGCHYMATWMDRDTSGLTQMGGEGVDWIGLSPYLSAGHVFQNMGEGTYFHSGLLAIRQSVAAGVDMTYKILFNDAVAMTGGQPVDGKITVPGLCQQLLGEGVGHVEVTTDEPQRYRRVSLPAGVRVHHRRELDAIQRRLREMKGVTVLIHDQTCAAEKRRRRKKKQMPEPSRRIFINTAVCEGCGDCGIQSNCLSVVPVETPFGRKRAIDQSSCNKDYTCADGFCPSFVSVEGARLRKPQSAMSGSPGAQLEALLQQLPSPGGLRPDNANILVVGVGGTGVVTVGAIIAMAANLEGRAVSVLDVTGLAQKGGAVVSHVRVAAGIDTAGPVRIDVGQADTAIVCDGVSGLKPEAWQTLAQGRTLAVLNRHVAPASEFTRDAEAVHDPARVADHYRRAVGKERLHMLDAHALAQRHHGDTLVANMILLGHAWQLGGVPLGAEALQRAIELNGVAVEANLHAFRLGRLAAWRPDALADGSTHSDAMAAPETLEAVTKRHIEFLTAYQDARYARRYAEAIEGLREAEERVHPGQPTALAREAAEALFRFMAIKDEYEVARLFTDGAFRRELEERFEGDYTLAFHMSPPLLARRDPATGRPRKLRFGPWMESAMRLLAYGRHLRGTALDIFSWQADRRLERRLLHEFEALLAAIVRQLDATNYADAMALVSLPSMVRGFGPVKAANAARYEAMQAPLRERFIPPPPGSASRLSTAS